MVSFSKLVIINITTLTTTIENNAETHFVTMHTSQEQLIDQFFPKLIAIRPLRELCRDLSAFENCKVIVIMFMVVVGFKSSTQLNKEI